jgi:hypothetical protein
MGNIWQFLGFLERADITWMLTYRWYPHKL